MQQMELFERIFSDAHVVDIDLSEWDKFIAFYVLADHAGRTPSGRLPMFVVEFVRVRSLDIEFRHFDHDPTLDLAPHQHVQWLIDDFRVQTVHGGVRITLWGSSSSPKMSIVCDAINIREMPPDIHRTLFPGWSRPYAGFIRPGLEALVRDRRAEC